MLVVCTVHVIDSPVRSDPAFDSESMGAKSLHERHEWYHGLVRSLFSTKNYSMVSGAPSVYRER